MNRENARDPEEAEENQLLAKVEIARLSDEGFPMEGELVPLEFIVEAILAAVREIKPEIDVMRQLFAETDERTKRAILIVSRGSLGNMEGVSFEVFFRDVIVPFRVAATVILKLSTDTRLSPKLRECLGLYLEQHHSLPDEYTLKYYLDVLKLHRAIMEQVRELQSEVRGPGVPPEEPGSPPEEPFAKA